ncbi:hypothetical protein ACQP2F_17105 [Actinoplanes sp. CA-030573]|uniref:hypothetical protein n=1 Tax=Actinoplanes sp. CA-030573 TaxID=3239898 RepID=UPI003D8C9458
MTTQEVGLPRSPVWVQIAGGLTVAALSAGSWWAWMGWDHVYRIDPRTDAVSGPYEAWQVVGCAVTLLVVLVAALLLGVRWFVASPVMTVAFTAAWTSTAAAADDTGMYGVGAIALLFGLTAGTTVVSIIVLALRRLSAR